MSGMIEARAARSKRCDTLEGLRTLRMLDMTYLLLLLGDELMFVCKQ